jgi:hypothetical protein
LEFLKRHSSEGADVAGAFERHIDLRPPVPWSGHARSHAAETAALIGPILGRAFTLGAKNAKLAQKVERTPASGPCSKRITSNLGF